MALELDLMRSFVAIAEHRTLSRAARQLGLTQAAVSLQVKRLERGLGRVLLNRTPRGVTLTPHGARLLTHAQRLIRWHDEAVAELSGRGLAGTLRFGCPDDYAAVFLPQLLRGFAAQHPQVHVEVVCASTPPLLERLRAHQLDLALISLPENDQSGAVIRHEPFVWVSAVGSDAVDQSPIRLALADRRTLDHLAARQSLERANRPYRVAYASGSLAGLLGVVRSGQAVAVLTRTAVPSDLQILTPGRGLPKLPQVGIAVRCDRAKPRAVVRALADHIRIVLPTL
ncbi:MAG: LysR family transcriptional regulator [Gemmatimonadetes bacterium]|nr:LysR family transcriptional regulator [Gemmatimonadota bacterium]